MGIQKGLGLGLDIAANGHEAVTAYEKTLISGKSYDAVLLDLTVKGGMGDAPRQSSDALIFVT